MRNKTKKELEIESNIRQYFYSKELLEKALHDVILMVDTFGEQKDIGQKVKKICQDALKNDTE